LFWLRPPANAFVCPEGKVMASLSVCTACFFLSSTGLPFECSTGSYVGKPEVFQSVVYEIAPYSELRRLIELSEGADLSLQNPDQAKISGPVEMFQWNFGSYDALWWKNANCSRGGYYLESVALRIDLEPLSARVCRVFNLKGESDIIRPSVLSKKEELKREWLTCEQWISEESAGRDPFAIPPFDLRKIPKQEKYVLPAINVQPIHQQVPDPNIEEETPF